MIETQESSRGRRLVDEIKRRPRAMQFSMRWMFAVSFIAAALLALPRLLGLSYSWYFLFLYMIAYGLAPLIGWTVHLAMPARLKRLRMALALGVGLLLVVPFWTLSAWYDGAESTVWVALMTLLWFWGPQTACIVLVARLQRS